MKVLRYAGKVYAHHGKTSHEVAPIAKAQRRFWPFVLLVMAVGFVAGYLIS